MPRSKSGKSRRRTIIRHRQKRRKKRKKVQLAEEIKKSEKSA